MSKSPVKRAAKEIAHELDDALDEVAHSLKKLAKHLTSEASDEMAQTAAGLAEAAGKLADEAKSRGKTLVAAAGREIKEHPAATAALAASAVAMVGLAVAQRRARTRAE